MFSLDIISSQHNAIDVLVHRSILSQEQSGDAIARLPWLGAILSAVAWTTLIRKGTIC